MALLFVSQLQRLQADVLVPENVRAAARRLTAVVDMEHHLPFEADALEDARAIIEFARQGKG